MDAEDAVKFRAALAKAREDRIKASQDSASQLVVCQNNVAVSVLKELLPSPAELRQFADKISLENLKHIDDVDEATRLMVLLREALLRWGDAIEDVFAHSGT